MYFDTRETALKMEVADSAQTFVPVYQTTWQQIILKRWEQQVPPKLLHPFTKVHDCREMEVSDSSEALVGLAIVVYGRVIAGRLGSPAFVSVLAVTRS
jgi:hypothetical protein